MALTNVAPIPLAQAIQTAQNKQAQSLSTGRGQWITVKIDDLVFATNPGEINITRGTRNITYDVLSLGEIVVPNDADLVRINFSSLFWTERSPMSAGEYMDWINEWRNSKKPGRLIIYSDDDDGTYHNLNMLVLFESMDTSEWGAGSEEDIYFTLNLIQYREGAESSTPEITDDPVRQEPIILPPEPIRIIEQSPQPTTYTVVSGDTLFAIAKKYGQPASAWRQLSDIPENDAILAANINRAPSWRYGDLIYPGQTFIIPSSWINN